MTDIGPQHAVRKYTGPTRYHPLMEVALASLNDRALGSELCDFLDRQVEMGATGPDVVDALRVIAGTLCDMQWMLKD
jgi:hypothetical protein